ncbi:orotidine-5'-phosphate decarboxylase [Bacillus andreraoultii]|uniref:orotidine-5'-phosphate decarboxylase n=1 Tax=Bacillus andreraoultii TaxID=1499685 RepID=UPI000539D88A|nr:orotidine-5'-phosphate decarboxylase [Bacillus andreraoultii]
MNNPVIIALDFASKQEMCEFLENFRDEKLFVKVGMELFYQEGPSIIRELKSMGHSIFLDLKLHDIPNTVGRAMKGIASLGVDLVTVHAAGGSEMMKAAIEGLKAGTPKGRLRPSCIAVTQLTSTSEGQMQSEQLVLSTIEQSVYHYASLAKKAGLDGVVSSVHEVSLLRKLGEDFLIVTPGIRLKEDQSSDQKRVATPKHAREVGSSAIVVGRSITESSDPYKTYQMIKQQWELIDNEYETKSS